VNDDADTLVEFRDRLLREWLPTFCNDPKRRYDPVLFRAETIDKVAPEDARDFMRALDHGVVVDSGGGRYRAALSNAFEQLFWNLEKPPKPVPTTLWIEPIVTIAALARLHLDLGWPCQSLGSQSEESWAFDLFVVKPASPERYYIAGEVKKNNREVDHMVAWMLDSCADSNFVVAAAKGPRLNAHKKWLGLKQHRPPFFWAIGPGKYYRLFTVEYSEAGAVSMTEIDDHAPLKYSVA